MYLHMYVGTYVIGFWVRPWSVVPLAKIFKAVKKTAKYVEMVLFVLRLQFARKQELVHLYISRD